MTGLVRKATLLVVLGVLVASAAMAGIPYQGNSVLPTYLDLYGCKLSVADPLAGSVQNKVIVRDIGNFPVVNENVCISFCTDVKLFNAIPGHPELVVTCGSPTKICGVTDINGAVTFYLLGGTINTNGVAAGTGANCATITVGDGGGTGSFSAPATVTVYDENGAVGVKGVEGGDLAGWLGDFGKKGTIGYKGRSDFSHNASVEGGDLSLWLKVFGLGNSGQSCGTLCP